MSETLTPSYFDELKAEQAVVQQDKFQGRLLAEYNDYIFPGQAWLEPRSCAVTDLLQTVSDEQWPSLQSVVRGMYDNKGGEPVHWADMGGGRGLALRQIKNDPETAAMVQTTNVDILDHGLAGLSTKEMRYLEETYPGITGEDTEPDLIEANVEDVALRDPADIITSIEVLQYVNNPLAAITNWYNQLADGGVMVVSRGDTWSTWLHYNDYREDSPTVDLLHALGKASIKFAATDTPDTERGVRYELNARHFRTLAIQKAPDTQIHLSVEPPEVFKGLSNYKSVRYRNPSPEPLITVESTAP